MINSNPQPKTNNTRRPAQQEGQQPTSRINRDGEWTTPYRINRDGEWEPQLSIGRNGEWGVG